jgi:hypothetical protein
VEGRLTHRLKVLEKEVGKLWEIVLEMMGRCTEERKVDSTSLEMAGHFY